MAKKILVTGGAGFIGSHLVDRLIEKRYEVTVLDNLSWTNNEKPDYLNKKARFIQGSIGDKELMNKIISDFQVVFHNAASVGIAQSNYEIQKFVENNSLGTAIILQSIIDYNRDLEKFILASSNTTYGEGLYECVDCGKFHPEIRTEQQVKRYGLDIVCKKCKKPSKPIPTPEDTQRFCNSIYSFTKRQQEDMTMFIGKTYRFPVTILRYFNVYGPRQSLSNPYTGVSAIFMSRIKNNNIPIIYEDGLQTRDFISVHDVIEANILALENPSSHYEIFNVGSGNPITIKSLAEEIYSLYNKPIKMQITNDFRKGDIRHCIADISKIKQKLNWYPKISFREGLKEIFEWSKNQKSEDKSEKADKELRDRGLVS